MRQKKTTPESALEASQGVFANTSRSSGKSVSGSTVSGARASNATRANPRRHGSGLSKRNLSSLGRELSAARNEPVSAAQTAAAKGDATGMTYAMREALPAADRVTANAAVPRG